MTEADIAVIGGSGLYRLFDADADVETVVVETPYGPSSGPIRIGEAAGRRVAFLARHGEDHALAPHRIPYRANIWALAVLGVRAVVTSSAVGGLSDRARPGRFVVPDQLIDRTAGRPDSFFDQDDVQHLAAADPFDPLLRAAAVNALASLGEDAIPEGTSVVIQGPRFSTRAESAWFRAAGADIVNMTQYPEAVLAAELGLGLVTIAFVTDTDAGTAAGETADAADAALVLERMAQAEPRIRAAIAATIGAVPDGYRPRALIPAEAIRRVLSAPVAVGGVR
ncbi:5'-methylthioadenosine phosphorylase [Leifsonia sp. 98AMF]|uniref:MTAP family purine nucleoside phosphorylase n=1 Tax=unclassified Leifsonia TaxID=2663824 RepID=UPI00087BE410|nr:MULTISPECIES: MTAP family purine nucleoside phosphorylase [unclassified Leifsonia]SDH72396.1 5'-methylthioadenosine phosphorylase [Leifsonia sp. 197AMF]SDJ49584.1 5'-methylthioadenosine phosphorylase [Leifsonia sp. 466MF]SDK25057.1 5'-methylthioadenosine phosphorylase [Leifsonia sp. 157MF]SDN69463.1 5'-methylthioadenosine phosphorylase [Leifsonia sp. 509MF]SEN38764.1 5'-methylthioadenosine phosphorylase [Leifsonia sp. 467MF]